MLSIVFNYCITESRQRSTASCSRALDVVRSVRERLLGGNAAREQRANFAPYIARHLPQERVARASSLV